MHRGRMFRSWKRNYEPCLVGPDKINLTKRGQGVNTRYINNIAMEDLDICDSLLVTEVFTPAGNWSSYRVIGTMKMIFLGLHI